MKFPVVLACIITLASAQRFYGGFLVSGKLSAGKQKELMTVSTQEPESVDIGRLCPHDSFRADARCVPFHALQESSGGNRSLLFRQLADSSSQGDKHGSSASVRHTTTALNLIIALTLLYLFKVLTDNVAVHICKSLPL